METQNLDQGSGADIMLLDEYLLQDEFYWVGDLEQQETPRDLKLLPGTSKRTLLEVGICRVYQEKAFWGESTIIELKVQITEFV